MKTIEERLAILELAFTNLLRDQLEAREEIERLKTLIVERNQQLLEQVKMIRALDAAPPAEGKPVN